jgi:hypothetical protein
MSANRLHHQLSAVKEDPISASGFNVNNIHPNSPESKGVSLGVEFRSNGRTSNPEQSQDLDGLPLAG